MQDRAFGGYHGGGFGGIGPSGVHLGTVGIHGGFSGSYLGPGVFSGLGGYPGYSGYGEFAGYPYYSSFLMGHPPGFYVRY
ncbi:hypothetical protein [Bacillus sp. NPDC077027]|uniref:hypothetical protein n=1 Tax=Bacillus sp. NPDC077027 TaxID=3390548 RepID=UPI003D031397